MYKKYIKRSIDMIASVAGLILLSPLFLILTIIIYTDNKGKPFFFQRRAGKHGVIFKMVKFRTMNDKKDENGKFLPFDQRVTKLGAFIRKHSLDEIPQLYNILCGDMSLIGPRPLHPEYLPLYNDEQKKRHDVIPGITGWAQINGRNTISWEQKFEHDVWYANNQSFKLDLKILLHTIYKVIKKKDINSSDSVNMSAFKGAKVE